MTDTMEDYMSQSYQRLKDGEDLSKEEFWEQLDEAERFAVFFGNMNYQVENGGFVQWWDNKYACDTTVTYILEKCKEMIAWTGSPAESQIIVAVAQLIENMWEVVENEDPRNCDDRVYENFHALHLDGTYYKINKKFMEICDRYLKDFIVPEMQMQEEQEAPEQHHICFCRFQRGKDMPEENGTAFISAPGLSDVLLIVDAKNRPIDPAVEHIWSYVLYPSRGAVTFNLDD